MAIAGVLERIQSNLDQLPDSERKVAVWIMHHPEQVLTLTVRDLAHTAQSSQAAVVRLCRSLQIDGYNRLKVLLTADLVRQEQEPSADYLELNPDASVEERLRAFSEAAQRAIADTLREIPLRDLPHLAQRLQKARRILVFGVGASQVVALDLSQKLMRLGYPVIFWDDVHLTTMATALFSPDDVVMLISFSGTTKDVLEVGELARRQGAYLCAITQFHTKNALSRLADLTFHVSASEPSPRIGATTSVLASLLIGDALMLWLANQDATRAIRHLKATEEAVASHRLKRD